jgi:hypothetical protein
MNYSDFVFRGNLRRFEAGEENQRAGDGHLSPTRFQITPDCVLMLHRQASSTALMVVENTRCCKQMKALITCKKFARVCKSFIRVLIELLRGVESLRGEWNALKKYKGRMATEQMSGVRAVTRAAGDLLAARTS